MDTDPGFLQQIGLSPVEILLTSAVAAIWAYFKSTLNDLKKTKDDQLNETRERVEILEKRQGESEKHILICEQDRIRLDSENKSLAREIDTLKTLVGVYRSCDASNCPLK